MATRGERALNIHQGFREECGVMAVWNHPDAAQLTYLGLYAQQHRGQEAAGIVSLGPTGKHLHHKGLGLVGEVFQESDLGRLEGVSAIGHVRYSTTGQNVLTNAQPLTANFITGPIAFCHNGNIVNSDELKSELMREGAIFQGTNDSEVLLHLLSRLSSQVVSKTFDELLEEALKRLEGAYSLVLLTQNQLFVARDPFGFRPLVLGKQTSTGSFFVASETCAFDLLGVEFVREIEPGEILSIDLKNKMKSRQFQWRRKTPEDRKSAFCVFEHVYFSRPDSLVFSESVYESRKRLGRQLAIESFVEADLVVPVPDSGVPAAIGFSQECKVPFELGIIRNHYIGRTFIQPHQSIRDFGVKIKLNPQAGILKGKDVIVIDDSLVRGTTSKKIVSMLRQAGAQNVHLRIAAPPTVGPCHFGVDTPQAAELIASHQTLEEIRNFIGADTLQYLSLKGMWSAVHGDESKFCGACFTGKDPFRGTSLRL